MCIDRPEHASRGKAPLPPGPTFGFEELFRGAGWAAVADWMAPNMEGTSYDFNDHGSHDPGTYRAAMAECCVRDQANFYAHRWEGAELVIFGEVEAE